MSSENPFNQLQQQGPSAQDVLGSAGLPPGFAPAAPQAPQPNQAEQHQIPVQRHPEEGKAIEVPVTRWVNTGRVATMSELDADASRVFPEEAGLTGREKREAWLNGTFGEGKWDLQEVPSAPQDGRSLHTPGGSNSDQLQSHLGTEPTREPQYRIRVKDDPQAPWNKQ